MIREPAFSGYFYPANPDRLSDLIGEMAPPKEDRREAVAVLSPHAGYVYSGSVAGAVFSSVLIPETCILLGPAHRGTKNTFAIAIKGSWKTPLGQVPIASDLAESIAGNSRRVKEDSRAHAREHSIEVQVPFLQYFRRDVSIVPLCVSPGAGFEDLEDLGNALTTSIKDWGSDVLIVASTDMSHYVDQETAKKKDFQAIDRILQLDPRGLFDVVRNEQISMCGYQPSVAALLAAKGLGASRAELVEYQTSGDRTGDYGEVVGYAGLRIF